MRDAELKKPNIFHTALVLELVTPRIFVFCGSRTKISPVLSSSITLVPDDDLVTQCSSYSFVLHGSHAT